MNVPAKIYKKLSSLDRICSTNSSLVTNKYRNGSRSGDYKHFVSQDGRNLDTFWQSTESALNHLEETVLYYVGINLHREVYGPLKGQT